MATNEYDAIYPSFEAYNAQRDDQPSESLGIDISSPAALATEQSVQLDPVPAEQPQEVKAKKRAAFGSIVKPEIYDLFDEHHFDEMPEADKNWVTPLFLRPHLFPAPGVDVPNRVGIIAVNPHEYRTLVRAKEPKFLRDAAFNKVRSYDDPTEERLAAAYRGGEHALESKLEAMQQHLAKMSQSREQLARLELRARAPGRGHETPQNLSGLVANAWLEFENILDVAHVSVNWTDEERERAETSFLYYLTQGSQTVRVRHWKEMLSLAKAYTTARINLFDNRIKATSKTLISA